MSGLATKLGTILRRALEDPTYETEYDGRMYTICMGCGKQDEQPHKKKCWVIEAAILLGVPKP